MIYGIGIDVIQPYRVARLLEKFGERFVKRVLTPPERERYERNASPVLFLANRFAAKEAFSKAMGTGFRYPVTLQCISVIPNTAGKPELTFSSDLATLVTLKGITRSHLTISDESNMACACVVLEI